MTAVGAVLAYRTPVAKQKQVAIALDELMAFRAMKANGATKVH